MGLLKPQVLLPLPKNLLQKFACFNSRIKSLCLSSSIESAITRLCFGAPFVLMSYNPKIRKAKFIITKRKRLRRRTLMKFQGGETPGGSPLCLRVESEARISVSKICFSL